VREFVRLDLSAESQIIIVIDDFTQVVAVLKFVLDLTEDFANPVFDGVCQLAWVVLRAGR
jgi:hypothetical protein